MSFPYKRILCPVDFDDSAEAALQEASALARASSGTVILFHAVYINPIGPDGLMLTKLQEAAQREARVKLGQMTEHLGQAACEMIVDVGYPADSILAAARAANADLIVMTTHGRRGVSRLLLGSVAEQVIRLSLTPVLAVHPAAER